MNVPELDWRRWWPFGVGIVGILLIVFGGSRMLSVGDQREAVVVNEPVTIGEGGGYVDSTSPSQLEVVVDVQGAVNKPGVYSVPAETRIAEVLMQAGGVSAQADLAYIAKQVNQAAKVGDGMKIYIPAAGEVVDLAVPAGVVRTDGSVAGSTSVNLNTASAEELDSLWGIGEARAKAIIENRPYSTLDEVREKAGIPANVMEENEGKMGI